MVRSFQGPVKRLCFSIRGRVADAYNSGNFRDKNVPTAYIEELVSHYNNVPLPRLTIHAVAGEGGALNLYHAMMDAIEFCGRGISALQDVPLELAMDNRILTVTDSDVQWNTETASIASVSLSPKLTNCSQRISNEEC